MEKPLVSVILPVRNVEAYIYDAIQSIIRQTYKQWELIIVNDHSVDRTTSVIKKIHDKRIKLLHLRDSYGISAALNLGIEKARGKFIARMDGDDLSEDDRFEEQVKYFHVHPECGVITSWIILINSQSKIIGREKNTDDVAYFKQELVKKNIIRHSSVMFKKDLINQYGGYNSDFDGAEDYDLWLRFAKYTTFGCVTRYLLRYRIQQSGVSYNELRRIQTANLKAHIHALRRYNYPMTNTLYVLKDFLTLLLPLQFKKYIYRKIYKYV